MLMRAVTRRADAGFSRNSQPFHDGWYGPGWMDAGEYQAASSETALKLSAFWRALFIMSNAGVASVPCITYRKRPDGGRERAESMPMYSLLHDAPNSWMTAPEYWDFTMRALVQRGNACSLIVPGPRGVVDQLIPLHPDRLEIIPLPGNGGVGYVYRPENGAPLPYTADEVFHVRVFADGGVKGKSLLAYMAEDTQHALSLSRFGRRLFTQGPTLAGALEVPGKLTDEQTRRMADSFRAAHSGPANWHSVAVLESGTKWAKLGMTNEDAQFLASREFMIRDLARWTGVKKYLLESEDTPSYNSIEAFQEEHVTYALRPWAIIIEQAIKRDLIIAPDFYFSEFLLDALMRGTPMTRAQALEIQRRNGVVSANEWRRVENMNRRDDAAGDAYWDQPNKAAATGADGNRSQATSARALAIARAASARVVRRETSALAKLATKHATDAGAFHAAAVDFYAGHAGFLREALGFSEDEARRHCTAQRGRIERGGLAEIETWATTAPDALARLALLLEDAS